MLTALLWIVAGFHALLTINGFREIGKPVPPPSVGEVLVLTACNVAIIAILVAAALELS